ncbi:HEAT repeat domain-containing protein [Actinomadura mexicana]|uniref:HEAT repeat-containing protein n=1 Tax=Actinomadura mexicana TaxID=134959 RepID=A0A239BXL4_9ACTN|nr:HEAT repeat domain-containing protein [Actinomadura mexicana]SNS12389.1 HEAT repeat-containing protein [Actinomadura mexicana]
MTSDDDAVLTAVRCADADRLPAGLDPSRCSPAVLRLLITHEDPRLRDSGLVGLAERLEARRDEDPSELAAFAESLPGSLDGSPEAALALAHLHLRLRAHVRPRPWPKWREAGLPTRVQIGWLSAEIADRPETLRDEPPGELLYQAVRRIVVADVDEPASFAQEAMDRPDPVLRAEALRVTREAVRAGVLAPERARALVVRLAGSIAGEPATSAAAAGVAAAALRELSEPWAAMDPLPQEHLYRFLGTGPKGTASAVAAAAIETAAHHGHRDVLRDVAADRSRPPGLRQRALELLGDLAGRDDIGDLVSLAATDPLLLAGPVTRCLRGLHRRGHFPAGDAVPAIARLAVADQSVPANEVATILFTCRHETLRELMRAPADDPHWPRRLDLLVALAAQGAGDLPVGEKVTDLLRSAPDPRPFLRAIRALRHTAAEEAVIAALPRSPAAAVETLEAVGGALTVTALRDALGLGGPDGGGAVVSHLRPVLHRALEVLWHLTEDPDRRRSILARLDPRDLPGRIAADLGGPDERELALLRTGLDPGRPVAALCRLARNAGSSTVPTIADLLLRVVSDLAASRAPGASGDAGEPTVPQEVVAALRDLGGRLHERGRIRPRSLLDAADAQEAGDALVAGVALDLLDRPELMAAEQMILLSLLLQTSHRGVRSRVHPLLRHRDRHVRKHAIALLARDADGEDAQALSASLIPLTAAPDVQTARQALLALGHARACWAAAAIAARLDHPNMNVKKTAANALIHAGAPVAVPKLLFWLGRHDNPGLRDALIEALRTILGDAYAATVVAAADRAADDRTRALLLTGLDGSLSARAVGALADQGSPAGAALLSLVAAGRLRLGSGTAAELRDRMAARGITPPGRQGPPAPRPDAELDALADRGWNTEIARRLAERCDRDPGELTAERLGRLRPMLERWLELAAERPEQRGQVLRLTLKLCPPPWTAGETGAFARSVRTLVAGLGDVGDAQRDRLLALLEDTVVRLPSTSRFDVAARIRALPPEAAGGRSMLVLLRRCGAVLTRADLLRALAAARAGANPWLAEEEVLREAFGPAGPVTAAGAGGSAETSERPAARRWRDALAAAARTPDSLRRFRTADRPVDPAGRPADSRDLLNALIGVFANADTRTRDVLLDWMIELQPPDAPAWTIAEDARRSASTDRASHPSDRDQPRSAVLRERLLEQLDDPARDQREAAARVMLGWPEPQFRLTVLRAFLDGRVGLTVSADLAQALPLLSETELRQSGDRESGGEAVRERIARVAAHLDPQDLERLIPLLSAWWENGGPSLHTSAGRALRKADPDVLAETLSRRLETGDWGLLDLISGVTLLRTPTLARAHRRLREEGRHDLADKLVLVDGPLRHPSAARQDSAALSALRSRTRVPAAEQRPARAELFRLARTGGPEQIRRALTLLAEHRDDDPARAGRHGADRPADQDHELEELLAESLGHPEARVRLHAHRISRKVLNREEYLAQTVLLLDDRQPDIVRSAVKTLCHAAWKPAVPALVDLLTHSHPAVRRAASDGLALLGAPAIPALKHAAGRARPDRRHLYTTVLEKITSAMAADLGPGGRPR